MRERLIELLEQARDEAKRTIGSMNNGFGAWYADYLLKNGVVIPPCNVGDMVYDISDGTPYETRVINFAYFGDHWACRTVSGFPDLKDFGTRIFLTKEEAKATLERSKQ